MKKIIFLVLAFVLLCGGAYFYHTQTLKAIRAQAILEQQEAKQQEDLMAQRIADIQAQLDGAVEEKESLTKKIDELLTEDVYYFDSEAIAEEIEQIGELASVEYRYTNVGTLDASKKWFKTTINIPGSQKTIVVTMDGVIKIGIDVNKIKIECNEEEKLITVKLPTAKLLSNELDENSIKVYDETTGILNKVTMEDSSAIRNQIKTKAEENAKDNGVYDMAKKNAENIIRCMLEAIPGLKETYSIEFR